ncbi:hypothetical protein SDC9_138539 [bioreactor metagenome]|uniref:Uncharacterized protein n=1 Tax=bioreactor metagenome TaxID=1076179 RepID=A0A645DPJ5_9ZZZZ
MGVDRQRLDIGHEADGQRTRFVGMCGEQRIDIAEQQQRVRAHQLGDQRGQPVVVTEVDLVGGDGVVLVDDRHHAHPQQRAQCAQRIGIGRLAGDIVHGQQDLTDQDAAISEEFGVALHQQPLTDRGGSLLVSQVARTPAQLQRSQARGDGARANQHDVVAVVVSIGQRAHQGGDPVLGETTRGAAQGRGTDLDHQTASGGDLLTYFFLGQHAIEIGAQHY